MAQKCHFGEKYKDKGRLTANASHRAVVKGCLRVCVGECLCLFVVICLNNTDEGSCTNIKKNKSRLTS